MTSGARRIALAISSVSIALAVMTVDPAPALAAVNTNPIDWSVRGTFGQGAVPLRVGQNDSPAGPGFGERHIVDSHGVVPPYEVMGEAVNVANCLPAGFLRVICRNDEVTVVFSTEIDGRSGDGRPVGIITAFFNAPAPV